MTKSFFRRLSATAIVMGALLMTGSSFAQTESGQISGTVLDASGAAVPGATLTAVSKSTGATRNSTSGPGGSYNFADLLPATYTITVDASGFGKTEQDVIVTVGARIGQDFHLQVGTTNTVVEVNATGVQVNTENQTIGEVVDQKRIQELPSLTRNPYDFIVTAGNVSNSDPGSQRGAGAAINGQRSAGTDILLDGAANNDEFGAGVGQQVPLDSVQEFSILTNNFTAEFGRASAGVVNVVTKSGTNAFHGSAYEYNRVSDLASNGFFNNAYSVPQSKFTRNQFGYSVGGPIIKNKLFFFENTEWIRVRSGAEETAWVPTPQLIAASAPATQAFFQAYGALQPNLNTLATYNLNQLVAQGFNPCGTAKAGSPCALLSPTLPLFSLVNYTTAADVGAGAPQNTYELVGRVDYNFSDKTQFYFRYALYNQNSFAGTNNTSPYAGYETGSTNVDNNGLISMIHTFSPSVVSESKAVVTRLDNLQPLGKNPVSPTLYFSSAGGASFLGNDIALPGYAEYTPGNAIPFGGPQNLLQFYEDLSWTYGKHTLKFGGDYVNIRDNRQFGAYEEAVEGLGTGNFTNEMNNFLSGSLNSISVAVYPQGKFPCGAAAPNPNCELTLPVGPPSFSRSNRYNDAGAYAQDTWKVKPRLTLNLGVRWEYYGVQHNANPQLDSNFYDLPNNANTPIGIANGTIQVAPNSPLGGLWTKRPLNFGPRLGFAYDVFGDGKTSIRGGYGIFYERNFGNVTYNVIQNPPNYYVFNLTSAGAVSGLPISTSNYGPLNGNSGSFPIKSASLRNVDSNLQTGTVDSWNFSIEHQIVPNMVLGLEYTGSHGYNDYSIANYNKLGYGNVYLGIPCDGTQFDCVARLTPEASTLNRRGNLDYSNYDGLNVRFRTNNIHHSGLNLLANYTWSHALDNGSSTFSDNGITSNASEQGLGNLNPFMPGLDYGNSDFDVRQRLVVSMVWDVPFTSSNHFLKEAFGGWSVAPIFQFQTGIPYSIYDCTYAANVCPYIALTGPVARNAPSNPPASGSPDTFNVINLQTAPVQSLPNPLYGFSDLPPYTSSMIGRNQFYGPSHWFLDMGVYKSFALTERFKLQLRAEAYNVANHANMWVIGSNTDYSSTPYIQSEKLGSRDLQLALRLEF